MRYASVLEAVYKNACANPDRFALYDMERGITYSQYRKAIAACGGELKSAGIGEGQSVVIAARPVLEYFVLFHALQLVRAVPVPVEKDCTQGRLEGLCRATEAAAVFSAERLDIDGVRSYAYPVLNTTYSGASGELPLPSAEAVSMILFTTGTTGDSKGIVMTHGADMAIAENVLCAVNMRPDNVELIPMPFNHSFAIRRYMASMANGSTAAVLDGISDMKLFFNMLKEKGITSIAMTPTAAKLLLLLSGNELARYAGQLDFVQLGSAPLHDSEKAALRRLLPDSRLYDIYGTTEAGCSAYLEFSHEDGAGGCIGCPTANAEAFILDEGGWEIRASKASPGILAWGGAHCMKEYLGEPDMTRKVFPYGRYIITSDMGYRDERGRIYMVGRKDDVINSGGYKISPVEVEGRVLEIEGILDAVCIGEAHKAMGQVPVVLAVKKAASPVTEASVLKALQKTLEPYMMPRGIVFVEKIEKTYNGKLNRKYYKDFRRK